MVLGHESSLQGDLQAFRPTLWFERFWLSAELSNGELSGKRKQSRFGFSAWTSSSRKDKKISPVAAAHRGTPVAHHQTDGAQSTWVGRSWV